MPKPVLYTVDGVTATLPYHCKVYEINERTVRRRMQHGMTVEDALKTPVLKVHDNEPAEKTEEPKKKQLKFIRAYSIGGYYDYV